MIKINYNLLDLLESALTSGVDSINISANIELLVAYLMEDAYLEAKCIVIQRLRAIDTVIKFDAISVEYEHTVHV